MLRLFNTVFVLLLLALIAGFATHKFLHHYWNSPNASFEPPVAISVDEGMTTQAVMEMLHQRGVLASITHAKVAQRLLFPGFVLKRGDYLLAGTMSLREVFELLDSGVSVQQKTTFIEGQTLRQVLTSEALLEQFNGEQLSDAELVALLHPQARQWMGEQLSVEGWFYPDTYYYTACDALVSILQRAHDKMLTYLQAAWEQREAGLPYQSPYEALIMASLIERETAVVDERNAIAGVFVRRLLKRMRLQTDPTVIYGMGDRYQGNLTRADLRQDTAYNTYTRHGLPPTPIALPSGAAIDAALHPEPGSSLYFVAKGDGRHHFSDTLEEQNKAVRRYQILQRRADYRSTPE